MRFSEHIINYLKEGMKLPEITQDRLVPKGWRKFQIADDLFYFVHDNGTVKIGAWANKTTTPSYKLFRRIAEWEERQERMGK
jgi:hypothetical protein